MGRNEVLDIIITFANACKKGKEQSFIESEGKKIWSAQYLLNQILRQYYIDDDHILVSKKAQELWDKIAVESDIKRFDYRKTFTSKVDMEIEMFLGSKIEGAQTSIKQKQKVVWNNIFHDEHTVPLNVIIKELCAIEELDYENVSRILDKIYICKMLKKEDRGIKQKSNRGSNVIEVVENDYTNTENGEPIQICDWEEIKARIWKTW